MVRHRTFILLSSLIILGYSVSGSSAANDQLEAGAAKVDITPAESAVQPTDRIRDHLFARAIVIRTSSTCAVLVGLDQGGARNDMVTDALARASKAINCPKTNFILSATHTHSGATAGLGGGDPTAKVVADAVVKAVQEANAKLVPARIAYGSTQVYLNVNRDLFDHKWLQAANPDGESDKTMSVVALIDGNDDPIGFYLNYAMHPINFYLTGVVSADFPGEASRYIEKRYDEKAVAIFTQGASGNQNPLLLGPRMELTSLRTRRLNGETDKYNQRTPYERTIGIKDIVSEGIAQMSVPLKPNERPAYEKAYKNESALVAAEGAIIGETAIDLFKTGMRTSSAAAHIWAGETSFSCPGRDRLDKSDREGVLPPYKDGAAVNVKIGLLIIGDITFVRVNGEVYNDIWLHLKSQFPARQALMVTLANGMANSGYIYSDAAASHLTFQVISSRLKPFCAEQNIISSAMDLLSRSGPTLGSSVN